MVWKKLRIDFTEAVKCEFCKRRITSGKGIVIQNEEGEFSFSGPSCAQNRNGNNVENPQERIIDITKGCLLYDQGKSVSHNPDTIANTSNEKNEITLDEDVNNYLDENAVEAYLTLRFEKLKHLTTIPRAEKLTAIYDTYKVTGHINEKDKNYIKMTMYGGKYPLFTYKNLQSVYAAEYWLISLIKNNADRELDFIKSCLHQLHAKLYLTPKQVIAINKFFNNSQGMHVKIKSNAFITK